ncbi:hypothetical protein PMSD_05030 [Paenibacillus macquariensis subsp. defensor]|nr:hypothetical protein PMSD_05030 [Paenibacillus macquariensis subsp. defensor]
MSNYSYDFFSQANEDLNLKEILKIEGNYSSVSFDEIFVGTQTTNTRRVINAIGRTGIITLENVLQVKFVDLIRIRNMGEGSQIALLDALLKYFNLGELVSTSSRREINMNELTNIVDKDQSNMRELLFSIFSELPVNQQEIILKKYK